MSFEDLFVTAKENETNSFFEFEYETRCINCVLSVQCNICNYRDNHERHKAYVKQLIQFVNQIPDFSIEEKDFLFHANISHQI